MNCKKGDLALIREPGLRMFCNCGAPILCVKPGTPVVCAEFVSPYYWRLEEPLKFAATGSCGLHATGTVGDIADEMLRPVRDPGDDAVDEMVRKVGPAPMTLTELMNREVVS